MTALRLVMKIFVAAALMALFATKASAFCGCSYGYYGYYGHGYGYGHPHVAYGYGAYPYAYGPPRYMVDQGPLFGGPNITDFVPRSYDPGYVNTGAYPYVGRYRYAARVYRRHVRYHRRYGW